MFVKLRNYRGDTIVEVLIAISIVSLTLTGAYASANRSANATRTAQERGEALKWAETQVEQIKATSGSIPNATFCYTPGPIQAGQTSLVKTTTTPCTSGNIPYKAVITQSTNNPGNFSVVVTWDGLSSATNRVELDYIK